MGQKLGYVTGSRRPRRCEVKRLRLRDGGGKVRGRKTTWFEVVRIGTDFALHNDKSG
jgi:hypothetical protein